MKGGRASGSEERAYSGEARRGRGLTRAVHVRGPSAEKEARRWCSVKHGLARGGSKRGPWGCVEAVCVRGISQRKLGWVELGVAAELRQKERWLACSRCTNGVRKGQCAEAMLAKEQRGGSSARLAWRDARQRLAQRGGDGRVKATGCTRVLCWLSKQGGDGRVGACLRQR